MSVGESRQVEWPKEIARLLGPIARDADVARARRIYVNRNLRMDEIELVGFDMDYTLAIYNQAQIERLSIECTLRKMIEKRGYDKEILSFNYDPAWGIRGLVVDRRMGNVFKADRYGHVGRVYHGSQLLDKEKRYALYRGEQRIRLSSPRYAWIDTLFALPEAVMYMRLVDYLEPKGNLRPARLWQDIRECIDEAHRDESMKTRIKAELGAYLVKDPELAPTLHKLRSSGKRLFLLTNSLWDYTAAVMAWLLDGALPAYPSWRSYFDVIVVGAAKPSFFTERTPFQELDPQTGRKLREFKDGQLQRGRVYHAGNLQDFEKMVGFGGDKTLYIGDHIYGDMLRSKKSSNWRTAMIIQELEHELEAQEKLGPRIGRLEELERRLPTLDSEINYAQLVLKSLAKLEENGNGGSVDRDKLETAKRTSKGNLEKLRTELRQTLEEHSALKREIDRAFNNFWGPLFKEGTENSRFGEQVEDYACVYTSRVSNFLAYSPLQYFRGPRDHMPHEF
jgi:HAD superfamily 5'-nucleotidase-like hydrolase